MYSFNGRFSARLDEKNRMRIPAKFKEDLGKGYKLALGPNECILVLPFSEYKKVMDSFGEVSIFDAEAQEAIAEFTSTVFDVTDDGQGRILLCSELREYAGIDKDIVITGAATHLRIEPAERYAGQSAKRNVSALYAKLNSLGKQA